MMKLNKSKVTSLLMGTAALTLALGFSSLPVTSAAQAATGPSLTITNQPLPSNLRSRIYSAPSSSYAAPSYPASSFTPSGDTGVYSSPSRAPSISPQDLMRPSAGAYNTMVGDKINGLRGNFTSLQSKTSRLAAELDGMQGRSRSTAAAYYASIGTISTQLQSGTTPGNPRLVSELNKAQNALEDLSSNLAGYNGLNVDIADAAATGAFLLNETRAAYGLSGAVEEDHIALQQLEDAINNQIVTIERLQNNLSDDTARTAAYVASEQANMRTLALAVTNGEFYGKPLSLHPYASAERSDTPQQVAYSNPSQPPAPNNPKPLVKIRFDKPDVNYEQPVYTAMADAIRQYPDARFELVAVEPTGGNAAQTAIESTRARRNAEKVLRTLTDMGVNENRIDMSTAQSAGATSSEVHIYIR
ncbi:MAG: hypothetical protein AB7E85_06255 [Pseudobdellovibrionaceae bacterium]